ncbi:MAG: DNA ligase [Shewanella sp.]
MMRTIIFLISFLWVSNLNSAPMAKLQLAGKDYHGVDVALYLVSEKLDGVRGYWDGNTMWSKQGHVIHLPPEFTANFPNTSLDGELWAGRGKFEQVQTMLASFQPHQGQKSILNPQPLKYMVFDVPHLDLPFNERYQWALTHLTGINPTLEVIEQYSLTSQLELAHQLDEVIAAGGEGLMLHLASAKYLPGDKQALIKVKPYMDAEATVIGYVAGKKALIGKMGALKVRTANGVEFAIGTGFSLEERNHPPVIGAVVTYRYQGLTAKGKPRFASFVRIRSNP